LVSLENKQKCNWESSTDGWVSVSVEIFGVMAVIFGLDLVDFTFWSVFIIFPMMNYVTFFFNHIEAANGLHSQAALIRL